MLRVVRCLFGCVLFAVCCLAFVVVRCMLLVGASWLLCAVCVRLIGRWLLSGVCRLLRVAC